MLVAVDAHERSLMVDDCDKGVEVEMEGEEGAILVVDVISERELLGDG